MTRFDKALDWLGKRIAEYIRRAPKAADPTIHSDPAQLQRSLRPGDVLLVDSAENVSNVVKYLTHSTWSHAALYVGDALGTPPDGCEPHTLIEVNLAEGCVSSPLSKYAHCNTRICRPVNLTEADREQVIGFMIERLGVQYDMRNVIDLARYLLPPPPVPARWRRRMIALGSGEPTRAICSTLIAEAFQLIRYPILPRIEWRQTRRRGRAGYAREMILHIRHHSLYAPCDFDLSPYFEIVKPTIEEGFNYKGVTWAEVDDKLSASQLAKRMQGQDKSR
jgi:Permuted papain-like amidase enzyme, YaeF/YiiX, C92 family